MKTLLCLTLLLATAAGANTFNSDGAVFEPAHGYTFNNDRYLINDGSFEGGTCVETPIWTCTTDATCDWIADLVPLGLWNYDGIHVAWLGGFCGSIPTCFTEICQEIILDGLCGFLGWWWMAYVNEAVMRVYITVDSHTVYEFYPNFDHHLLDYQFVLIDVADHTDGGYHWLCFNMDNPGCLDGLGDNYFIDYIEVGAMPTSTVLQSISTIKALY